MYWTTQPSMRSTANQGFGTDRLLPDAFSGRPYHRFPKVSVVGDVAMHLILGAVIDRGPKPDDIEFHRLARQAHRWPILFVMCM